MKELIGTSANVLIVPRANAKGIAGASTLIEFVLVLAEPEFGFDAGGITKSRVVSTLRFCASASALRKAAESMTDLADKGEDLDKSMAAMMREEEEPS